MKSTNEFVMIVSEEDDDSKIYDIEQFSVYYRMPYIPIFEKDFNELKKLQVAIREKDFYEENNIVVAIDFTEWIGHENDSYFISTIRFLHDHKDKWKYLFVLNEPHFERMLKEIQHYLTGEVFIAADHRNKIVKEERYD